MYRLRVLSPWRNSAFILGCLTRGPISADVKSDERTRSTRAHTHTHTHTQVNVVH